MTTVYSVSGSEGTYYVPRKAQALKEARNAKRAGDQFAGVTRIVVTDSLSRRDLYCALLNSESFAAEQEEVAL